MSALNDSQKRSILSGFVDIDHRMAELEAALIENGKASPFARYVPDLSPTEIKVVRDYFERMRLTMVDCLKEAGIPLTVRRTSARWTLQVGATFLNVAISEFSPGRLRGYGSVDPAAAEQVAAIQEKLWRIVDRIATYLRQGLGFDLAERLARLEASRAGIGTLPLLEKAITSLGLVEFQPQLELIVRRLESPRFEIAVFGRVSSGKSSLLNHVVGRDVLPVGVTPITAVPTRVTRGDAPAALVAFAEEAPRTVPVEELALYASEEGNPGNHKHVIAILVELPAPRLREGIVFVDTPGVGSLARSGAAETFAYLPRCDLGVVLVDAASTLTAEDLGLVRLLYEAGIPAQVLLSKVDVLAAADRERAAEYVRGQIQRELGLELPVHLVSTVGADERLLDGWFEGEIEPLLARHRSLAEASLRRKIASLHEAIVATLRTRLASSQGRASDDELRLDAARVRRRLDEADEAIRQAQERCREWTGQTAALLKLVLHDAAHEVVTPSNGSALGAAADGSVPAVLGRVLTERGQMAARLAADLKETLARALEALAEGPPRAEVDAAAIRDVPLRGLPAWDLHGVNGRLRWRRPWWGSLSPRLAEWSTRHAIQNRLGPLLGEQVELYDRQLQAWLKFSVGQLVERYEAQSEIFRERARLAGTPGLDASSTREVEELRAALAELERAGGADASSPKELDVTERS